jgi:hypothetical protein
MFDLDALVEKAIDELGRRAEVDAGRAYQRERREKAVAARDWTGALQFTSSFDRFDVFLELAPHMTTDELRACLTDIWTSCDGCIWPNRRAAVAYLRSAGYVGELPQPTEPLTLYRGVFTSRHRLGISWSTSIDTARYFVRPGGRGPNRGGFVYCAVAPPEAVLAGFSDRSESEYVIDPALLRSVHRVEVVAPEPGLARD